MKILMAYLNELSGKTGGQRKHFVNFQMPWLIDTTR